MWGSKNYFMVVVNGKYSTPLVINSNLKKLEGDAPKIGKGKYKAIAIKDKDNDFSLKQVLFENASIVLDN